MTFRVFGDWGLGPLSQKDWRSGFGVQGFRAFTYWGLGPLGFRVLAAFGVLGFRGLRSFRVQGSGSLGLFGIGV